RQPLKPRRESTRRLRPRQLHHPDSMLNTLGPRWLGMQDRLVLAGVQMTPLTLPLMIIEPTVPSPFRAWPVHHLIVVQVHVDLALSQLQFHSLYEPRCCDSENLPIKFTILHPS